VPLLPELHAARGAIATRAMSTAADVEAILERYRVARVSRNGGARVRPP
jgi:hypothetical protein